MKSSQTKIVFYVVSRNKNLFNGKHSLESVQNEVQTTSKYVHTCQMMVKPKGQGLG